MRDSCGSPPLYFSFRSISRGGPRLRFRSRDLRQDRDAGGGSTFSSIAPSHLSTRYRRSRQFASGIVAVLNAAQPTFVAAEAPLPARRRESQASRTARRDRIARQATTGSTVRENSLFASVPRRELLEQPNLHRDPGGPISRLKAASVCRRPVHIRHSVPIPVMQTGDSGSSVQQIAGTPKVTYESLFLPHPWVEQARLSRRSICRMSSVGGTMAHQLKGVRVIHTVGSAVAAIADLQHLPWDGVNTSSVTW
jgi:hypothetical protein